MYAALTFIYSCMMPVVHFVSQKIVCTVLLPLSHTHKHTHRQSNSLCQGWWRWLFTANLCLHINNTVGLTEL